MSYSSQSGARSPIPSHFKVQYSAEEIAARVAELGEEVGAWCSRVWSESRTDVVTIPILRGGLFFFSDLARRISSSVEVAPVRVSSYDQFAKTQLASVKMESDALPVKGRVVLLVDDVCESGRTLQTLETSLMEQGAREVRSVVLIRRLLNKPTFVPCWVGFEYSGPEWFVGYGLEDNERWRNLPSVHIIQRGA